MRDFSLEANGWAWQKQQPAKKILRAEDFANHRLERGSGREEVTFVIEINQNLSPFVFRLIPDLTSSPNREHRHAGTIEVSKMGSSRQPQIIEVGSALPAEWFVNTFNAEDINFDGYLDISTLNGVGDMGATSSRYWLFDPGSERFIANSLTDELDRIKAVEWEFDPKSETIRFQYRNIGESVISETYKIEDGHLALVEFQERRKGAIGNWEIVTQKVVRSERRILKIKGILTAEDFAERRLESLSSLAEEETFVIEINASLAPLVFRLIPDLTVKPSTGCDCPAHVGTIEISRLGFPAAFQRIEVISDAGPSWFTNYFKAQDIDFDGYLDIAVVFDFSAKSRNYHHWLFDPASGKFITNNLTRQLGKLESNRMELDPKLRTIHLSYLLNDQARVGETYKVEGGQLVLIEIEETQKDCGGNFEQVRVKIINGKREGKDVLTLEPCRQITQNIAPGQTHHYRIMLDASQSLCVEILLADIDLVMTLFGPDGKRLAVVETTEIDQKGLSYIADVTGVYRLDVRPLKEKAAAGEYWIEQRPTKQ